MRKEKRRTKANEKVCVCVFVCARMDERASELAKRTSWNQFNFWLYLFILILFAWFFFCVSLLFVCFLCSLFMPLMLGLMMMLSVADALSFWVLRCYIHFTPIPLAIFSEWTNEERTRRTAISPSSFVSLTPPCDKCNSFVRNNFGLILISMLFSWTRKKRHTHTAPHRTAPCRAFTLNVKVNYHSSQKQDENHVLTSPQRTPMKRRTDNERKVLVVGVFFFHFSMLSFYAHVLNTHSMLMLISFLFVYFSTKSKRTASSNRLRPITRFTNISNIHHHNNFCELFTTKSHGSLSLSMSHSHYSFRISSLMFLPLFVTANCSISLTHSLTHSLCLSSVSYFYQRSHIYFDIYFRHQHNK